MRILLSRIAAAFGTHCCAVKRGPTLSQARVLIFAYRARVVRGSCKFYTTRRSLQYSRTAKYDFAVKRACTTDGAKFRFKFIRRYGANFIKYTRSGSNFVSKFYTVVGAESPLAPQINLPRAAKICPCKTPHAKQLVTRRLRYINFGAWHERSCRKSAVTHETRNTLHRYSVHEIFPLMYSRGKPNFCGKLLPLAVAKCFVSARRDLKFRSAAANSKIPKPKKAKF